MSDYIAYAAMITYFGTRADAALFVAASSTIQTDSLHFATVAINNLPLKGWKCNPETQDNQFPRYIPLARGGYMGDGVTVPQAVKDACCEEGLEIFTHGADKRLVLQNQHVASMRLGDLSESYALPEDVPALTARRARDLMAPFIARGGVPLA
jgi:hypothetical protein